MPEAGFGLLFQGDVKKQNINYCVRCDGAGGAELHITRPAQGYFKDVFPSGCSAVSDVV